MAQATLNKSSFRLPAENLMLEVWLLLIVFLVGLSVLPFSLTVGALHCSNSKPKRMAIVNSFLSGFIGATI